MRIALFLIACSWALSACQHLFSNASAGAESAPVDASARESDPAIVPHTAVSPALPSPSTTPNGNELELKLARLWARVDELENQSIQQKERMKLIEKGLLLGIIPDELKGGKSKKKVSAVRSEIPAKDEEEASVEPPAEPAAAQAPKEAAQDRSKDLATYKRLLQKAQEKFNAAQYGQAIVLFNEVGDGFDDSLTEGSHLYWIGLSWYYLKEFQLAEQSFKNLREKHPENLWVAHARYYQAKIDQTRGLSKRALEQFSQLMEEFASQDLGEMARMEVARMREKL